MAITSNTSTFTNITVTTPDNIASYYMCMHARRALHEKSDLRQIYLVQIRSKKVLTGVKSKQRFAYKFTTPCKLVCKCAIHHLCH